MIDAVSKKFEEDVKGITSLFEEKPATYPRPPTLPVAGNTLDIAQGGHETLLKWALEYGNNPAGVHEVQMLGQTILHVVDPKLARELMVAKSDEFPDRGVSAMAKFFREDQAAFVNTSGEQWMAYRKMGTASVNGSALDRLAGKVAERAEALARAWRRKAETAGRLGGDGAFALEVDVDTATQAVTLEVIHEALFSETLDVIDEEPGAVALARSFRRFNEANQDLLNDFLQLYQRFDTPDAHRRETHRARLRAHFDARADARVDALAELETRFLEAFASLSKCARDVSFGARERKKNKKAAEPFRPSRLAFVRARVRVRVDAFPDARPNVVFPVGSNLSANGKEKENAEKVPCALELVAPRLVFETRKSLIGEARVENADCADWRIEKRVDAFYAHRTRPALTINTLANALYKVFCASGDSSMEEMRKACFEYLRLGGSMSAGPIALLGGLETNPLTLVSQFFSVALFGVTRLMTPLPTPARILKGANLLKGAVKIISPIVWGEGLVRMFVPSQLREKWGWI